MTQLVPASEIEAKVGIVRHRLDHYGRAVSAEQQLYILHSQACLDSGIDLRDCIYSIALDEGIDPDDWEGSEDQAVVLTYKSYILAPARVCIFCGCNDDRTCSGGCYWPSSDRDVCSTCARKDAPR